MFERALTASLALGSTSGGDNLLGFEIDGRHALERNDCSRIRVRRTSDPRCRLVIEAQAPAATNELQALAVVIWSKLRYRHFEAHVVERGTHGVTLRFVTRTATSTPLIVTGRIVLERAG